MVCPNCDGGTIFGHDCACTLFTEDKQPNPDCEMCAGSGKVDQECWYCGGHGELFEEYDIVFRNEAGETASVRLDLRPSASASLPLTIRERDNPLFPGLKEKTWRVDLWQVVGPPLQELGFESMGDVLTVGERGYGSADMLFYDAFVGSNRAGHDPDPDEGEMRTSAREELAARFARSLGATDDTPKEIRVLRKPPVDELLDNMRAAAAAGGDSIGFSIVVAEGNIATGEAGWQVYLTVDGKPVREIAIAYDLAESLMNALKQLRELPLP